MRGPVRVLLVLLFGAVVSVAAACAPDTGGGAQTTTPFTPSSVMGAGAQHSCVVTTDGALKCWGANWRGQLGNGTRNRAVVPTVPTGLGSGVVDVAVGWAHTCALTEQGGVKCWGTNQWGEAGNGVQAVVDGPNGNWGEAYDVLTPTDVVGLQSGVRAIYSSNFSTCALMDDGTAKCWGANFNGQIGDGTYDNAYVPVDVIGITPAMDVVSLSMGSAHTCALDSAGAVSCWGTGGEGQLGPDVHGLSTTPVQIPGLDHDVVELVSGDRESCALTDQGSVLCWGLNPEAGDGTNSGLLGFPTTAPYGVPAQVIGLESGVTDISAGNGSRCATMTDGSVRCWGRNDNKQLGDRTTVPSPTPVRVEGLDRPAVRIINGEVHTCAMLDNFSIRCWGGNGQGQLGQGLPNASEIPVTVAGTGASAGAPVHAFEAVAISSGGAHTCAVTTTGSARCWGNNDNGQLGRGTTAATSAPRAVGGLGYDVASISAGERHTCAVTVAGAAMCWGANARGQLGDGTFDDSTRPHQVVGLDSGVVSISAGSTHTCAVLDDGSVRCWGGNDFGTLGDGHSTDDPYGNQGDLDDIASAVPVAVSGITSGASAVTAGFGHSCAIVDGGSLCWGLDTWGQLGRGGTPGGGPVALSAVPVAVDGLDSGVTSIRAALATTCAVADGTTYCWGKNDPVDPDDATSTDGLLGFPTTADSTVPVLVSGVDHDPVSLSVGSSHQCVVTSSGSALCWGGNAVGQLGNGNGVKPNMTAAEAASPTPVTVFGLGSGVVSISAGRTHTCALLGNGGIRCWGGPGTLGNGTGDAGYQPVRVSGTPTA